MQKHLPLEVAALRRANPKAILWTFQSRNPYDCPNCNGVGRIYVFDVREGPLAAPTPKPKGDLASTWFDGQWWDGVAKGYVCPDCLGLGRVEQPRPPEEVA